MQRTALIVAVLLLVGCGPESPPANQGPVESGVSKGGGWVSAVTETPKCLTWEMRSEPLADLTYQVVKATAAKSYRRGFDDALKLMLDRHDNPEYISLDEWHAKIEVLENAYKEETRRMLDEAKKTD